MGIFDKLFGKSNDVLYAPVAGSAVPVAQVPDPAFAENMLGYGMAVIPSEGKVYAPCDATVENMFHTGHAVTLVSENGAEILVHIGLDTVKLGGKHFTVHCANGDKVKKGDLLIEFDLEAIKAEGYNSIVAMLVVNSKEFSEFQTSTGKMVTNADAVIELGGENYVAMAAAILEAVGGKNNVVSIDHCITRLRLELKDRLIVDDKKIKAAGANGVLRPGKSEVQIVIGPKIQFVYDEFKTLCE
jgi:PTS system beta-glucosides-specific IIC component